MSHPNLTHLILKGDLDSISDKHLGTICASALIEFSAAIGECADSCRVRLNLASQDRESKIDGLYKIRGSLKARAHRARVVRREVLGMPGRRRSPSEIRQLRRVVIQS